MKLYTVQKPKVLWLGWHPFEGIMMVQPIKEQIMNIFFLMYTLIFFITTPIKKYQKRLKIEKKNNFGSVIF